MPSKITSVSLFLPRSFCASERLTALSVPVVAAGHTCTHSLTHEATCAHALSLSLSLWHPARRSGLCHHPLPRLVPISPHHDHRLMIITVSSSLSPPRRRVLVLDVVVGDVWCLSHGITDSDAGIMIHDESLLTPQSLLLSDGETPFHISVPASVDCV